MEDEATFFSRYIGELQRLSRAGELSKEGVFEATQQAFFIERFPLLRFSGYTHLQSDILTKLGLQLLETLETTFEHGTVNGRLLSEAYSQFWLWTLGAYEFVRTMDQHSACFSTAFAAKVKSVKRELACLRVPFAKQELSGRANSALKSEASFDNVDAVRKDISFMIGDRQFWMRQSLAGFGDLVLHVSPEDVICPIGVAGSRR